MNKKELTERVTGVLRDNDIKKPVRTQRHVFHITDDVGNTADFVVKSNDKKVIYTRDDVAVIVDTCLAVITDSLKRGEELNIRGFGVLGLHKRAPRRAKIPGTEDWVEVEGRYVPKFYFGNDLRMAARVYELSLDEKYANIDELDIEYFEDGEDD